ncbi:MAG: D-glycero-beta-D-manno-heptose 1-phosphate adenylyltransferase [Bdellovibrionaceae bacterium]|nr:D-glycero-beta-D-manno-heptose 1-phosphate adenylyltransferase [Pseudobdellovibrionaceae bacterium]
MGHFLSEDDLLKQIAAKKAAGRKIVFTNGCFDLLHVGHVRYLQAARQLGDELVVALNSDASVKRLKGPERPIQTENDRAEIMAALGCVSFSVLFTEDTPARIIEAVKPDVLVKGGDWKIEQIVGGTFVQSYGGEVRSLQFIDGKSTTKLIEKART